ncbi:hypothetical protein [Dyella nitratireducens]|uniref:Uncharacterized protein n=1 Tax=Dyella nitratireducens TaxID=1849580 RepID=A0ABQ1GKU6_9GAMM|nr:hypothetical protein [Dyella nitratireducens]GGA45861.1 hypothetical protein GCM10010981_38730 [Dyella nitratireducens]GLQ41373.1 hypothetical protein GCM10007902_12230 [Dyella nitratireducens]
MKRSGLSFRTIGLLILAGSATAVHAQHRDPVAGFGMPVSTESLAKVRGGFDLGGLEVSFGIQRAIYVDGNLVTYLNVTIPDISHITAQQATSLAEALGTIDVQVGSGNSFNPSMTTQAGTASVAQAVTQTVTQTLSQAASSSAVGNVGSNSAASASSTQASGAGAFQSVPSGPTVTSTIIPASAAQASAATVIQNTVNNQLIRSLTTLNVAVSALNAMRNQGLQQSLQAAQQLQALSH